MTGADSRLLKLIKAAPSSTEALMQFLLEGLHWPIPETLDLGDVPLDWTLKDLHLDPERVARLRSIRQIPRLVNNQRFGVFILDFDGGALPIGAVRRVVDRLVATARSRKNRGTLPSWALDELLFFCQTTGTERTLHVVALREDGGRRQVRVSSWSRSAPEARLELVLRRTVPDLNWVSEAAGPAICLDVARDSFHGYRYSIKSADALAKRMAEVARDVRDEVLALYEVETDTGPIRTLFREVREQLIADLTPDGFADVYAQTMVYGLLTARIAHPEKFRSAASVAALDFENPFLDAIYARFRSTSDSTMDIDELGLADLAEELAGTDIDEVLADFGAKNRRDDPVVHFYEDFLNRYDNRQRVALGAFFTPTPVVQYILRSTDHAVREAFGLEAGIASQVIWKEYTRQHPEVTRPSLAKPSDHVVQMLDPATGTGTFLVEWLRFVSKEMPAQEAMDSMAALEISLASYAVAHLKLSLEAHGGGADRRLPAYLADTLAPPRPQVFDEMADPVSAEGTLADRVKFGTLHNVIIGNPPYDRVAKQGVGGFVMEPRTGGRSLFDDILDPAKKHTIFSHHASLYNLYVYFWRWSLWKAFEEQEGPAVVSFITASSWLTGPGFVGLRQLARELADHIDVVDLGGDNKGARKDENVFDIETPVAIVTLRRGHQTNRRKWATVRYRRVDGSREDKLTSLAALSPQDADGWINVPASWIGPLAPVSGGKEWAAMPALADLFPWQQPGAMVSRTWPIAADEGSLLLRWKAFVAESDLSKRASLYVTPNSGRNIHTRVGGLPRLADAQASDACQPIRRYGARSFDRQWIIQDPRLAKTESPSLWASLSDSQVFMVSLMSAQMSAGPGATATAHVPDKHYFCGRGGKDVIPLYRDALGTLNVDTHLLNVIMEVHNESHPGASPLSAQRLFAYVYGVLAGGDYTERFHEELETPGPRVPLTSDRSLFDKVADLGEQLLWLHTYAERFGGSGRGSAVPIPRGLTWETPVTIAPATPRDVGYDSDAHQIMVGNGRLSGVLPEVWDFEVSGMPVVKKWLGYRTLKGSGKAASSKSPLDSIRPNRWLDEWSTELVEMVAVLTKTLEIQPKGIELLDEVCAGPLIPAASLPVPPESLRQPPATLTSSPDGLF